MFKPNNQRNRNRHRSGRSVCQYPICVEDPTENNPGTSAVEMLCICNRDSSAYYCSACGGFFFGRLTQPCEQHPNVIYLMDINHCVHCQAGHYMLRPVQLDRQTVLEINAADTKMKYMRAHSATK